MIMASVVAVAADAREGRGENSSAAYLTLADGRRLRYRVFGDADGQAVLALHGTPGSHLKFASAAEEARRLGLTLVSVDRWGYGDSDAPPRARLAAYADDAAALMTALGHRRFAVLGISGGGPFAVAVAAGLPSRVTALALVAPVGEIARRVESASGSALNPFHAFCFLGLARVPIVVRLLFLAFRGILAISPTGAIRIATARACASDRAIMRDRDAARQLARTFSDGLRGLAPGPALDLALFRRVWDFDLGAAVCPARVWIGTADRNVPQAMARHLARRLAHGTLATPTGAGHYWIIGHTGEVLAWLAAAIARGTAAREDPAAQDGAMR